MADLGVAVLRATGATGETSASDRAPGDPGDGCIDVTLLAPPFAVVPPPVLLAEWLDTAARAQGATLLLVDGPSAWKSPSSSEPHARRAERLLNTPGKTGCAPDGVKPRGYLGFTRDAIALFEALTVRGWSFPVDGAAAPDGLVVCESFPTAAWRRLALRPLPGAARGAPVVTAALASLRARVPLRLDGVPTHDQLQAIVAGVAGVWWLSGRADRVELVGAPPMRGDHGWEEGWILVPTSG